MTSSLQRTSSQRGITADRLIALGWIIVALASRLPWLSGSPDEVDSVLFSSALADGLDVSEARPHAPGYPLYVFFAWLLKASGIEPLLALTLTSAIFGSLAVGIFYLLMRRLTSRSWAMAGGLVFLLNPLLWMYSEPALSDATGLFFAVLLARLALDAHRHDGLWICTFGVLALAIGTRPSNGSLALLLLIPLAMRWRSGRPLIKPLVIGCVVFVVICASWGAPLIAKSGGIESYLQATEAQMSCCVSHFGVLETGSPWLANVLLRLLRFTLGYFLVFPWLLSSEIDLIKLAQLAVPLVGMAYFLASARWRREDVFLVLWLVGILPVLLQLHFLARYALPFLPAALAMLVLGYARLAEAFRVQQASRFETLARTGVMVLVVSALIFGLPQIHPVEDGTQYLRRFPQAGRVFYLLLPLAVLAAVIGHRALRRLGEPPQWVDALPWHRLTVAALTLLAGLSLHTALLRIPEAHRRDSPPAQLVRYVEKHYDLQDIVLCPGPNTWALFRQQMPQVTQSADITVLQRQISEAHQQVLFTFCPSADPTLTTQLGKQEVARFMGDSLLWAKSQPLILYAIPPGRSPEGIPPTVENSTD